MHGDGADGPTLGVTDAMDDGYVSPEFNLGLTSEHNDPPPQKRQKFPSKGSEGPRGSRSTALVDEEVLALALLRGR